MHCSLQESVGASRGILVLLLNAEGVGQLWHADTHAILGASHEELKDATMCLDGPQRGLIHRVGEATRARHPLAQLVICRLHLVQTPPGWSMQESPAVLWLSWY